MVGGCRVLDDDGETIGWIGGLLVSPDGKQPFAVRPIDAVLGMKTHLVVAPHDRLKRVENKVVPSGAATATLNKGKSIVTDRTEADLATLRADVAQFRKDLSKITDTLQEIARHGAEKVGDKAKSAAQTVTREIEERPLTAVLTAFGIGAIAGMLFSRRS